jgi:hypothetical protein
MLPQPVSPWRVELGSDIHDLRVSFWLREGVLPPEIAGKWRFRPYFCHRKQPICLTASA